MTRAAEPVFTAGARAGHFVRPSRDAAATDLLRMSRLAGPAVARTEW
jgi:hypothetical protein